MIGPGDGDALPMCALSQGPSYIVMWRHHLVKWWWKVWPSLVFPSIEESFPWGKWFGEPKHFVDPPLDVVRIPKIGLRPWQVLWSSQVSSPFLPGQKAQFSQFQYRFFIRDLARIMLMSRWCCWSCCSSSSASSSTSSLTSTTASTTPSALSCHCRHHNNKLMKELQSGLMNLRLSQPGLMNLRLMCSL